MNNKVYENISKKNDKMDGCLYVVRHTVFRYVVAAEEMLIIALWLEQWACDRRGAGSNPIPDRPGRIALGQGT